MMTKYVEHDHRNALANLKLRGGSKPISVRLSVDTARHTAHLNCSMNVPFLEMARCCDVVSPHFECEKEDLVSIVRNIDEL